MTAELFQGHERDEDKSFTFEVRRADNSGAGAEFNDPEYDEK